MWLRTFLLSVLLTIVVLTESSAKSYEIPAIRIEVSINEDGTVLITEHLTYEFDGSFSWAQYQLPKQGFTGTEAIQISENGKSYLNKNNEDQGTFSVSESDEYIRLKWHFNAEDERRTFTVSYTLEGALTTGPEWSQFYWNYLSDEREKSTKQLDISINFSKAVPSDSLYGWTRRPLGRMNLQKEQGKIIISGNNIDDNDFAKVRTLFPTSILTNPEITNPNFTLSQVRSEEQVYEQKIAKRKNRAQYWDQTGEVINYVIALLAFVIFYLVYQKYGKRYSTSHLSSTETIVTPGRERPAAIGWLLNGRNIISVHLISTVLDLARRGYFKIQEGEPEEGMFKDDDPTFLVERTRQALQDDLLSWEQDIIQFIEKRLDDDVQKLHKIFEGSNSKVSSWFSKWKNKFKTYCFDQDWIDLQSYKGAYWNWGFQLLLFSIVVGLMFYIGIDIVSALSPSFVFSWFGALIATFVLAILSLIIIRPTQKGAGIKHQWTNYKKGLKNAEEHHISSDKLDKHFIYALAFGLGKDKIEKIFTSNNDAMPVIAWMVLSTNTTTPADVASTFSTLGATGAASAPGTSGGAGASASAAGGGASASAG